MRSVLWIFIGVLVQIFVSSEANAQAGTTPVYLKFRSDKIYIIDEQRVEFVADLYVGTWETPIQGFYAATFDLTFSTDVVLPESTSFVYNTQAFSGKLEEVKILNKGSQLPSKGHINISISRLDGKSVNGFGKIGEVHFITVGDLIGSRQVDEIPFTVKAEYVKLLDVDGRELPNETDADGATIIIVNDILARNARNTNARQIDIYPNPARDQLYIQLQNLRGEELEIFNINGQRVKREQVRGDQVLVDTKDLRPGVYMIKIHTEEGIITRRVLLQ